MVKSNKITTAILAVLMVAILAFSGLIIGLSFSNNKIENVSAQSTQRINDLFKTEASTSTDSGSRYFEGTMATLLTQLWLPAPTQFIVEVPSEMWSDGTIRWQQVPLDYASSSSTTFTYIYINTSNGQFSWKNARVTASEIANTMILVQMDELMGDTIFPASRTIWVAQNQ